MFSGKKTKEYILAICHTNLLHIIDMEVQEVSMAFMILKSYFELQYIKKGDMCQDFPNIGNYVHNTD